MTIEHPTPGYYWVTERRTGAIRLVSLDGTGRVTFFGSDDEESMLLFEFHQAVYEPVKLTRPTLAIPDSSSAGDSEYENPYA